MDTPQNPELLKRVKRRKLFHDEEPGILDIKCILRKHDSEMRTQHGAQIMASAENRQPLSTSLRRKLIHVACHSLMNRTNSSRPSTDQRKQLADCIVDQLFHYMAESEKQNLKMSNFTPSSSYKDQARKAVCKRPMGYIQSFFVNFWQRNKHGNAKDSDDFNFADVQSDPISEYEYLKAIDWLKNNRGPPQKIFEKLNQTFNRRMEFFSTSCTFAEIITTWPRMFDIDGAIQNDFSTAHPLVSDNLIFNWKNISAEILKYANVQKRLATTLGILIQSIEERYEVGAMFLLPFLIRSKNKKVCQISSVEAFIKVVDSVDEIDQEVSGKIDSTPRVLIVGNKQQLLFEDAFVLFHGKVVKCLSLIEAIDLAFKSFYVFKVEFPSNCFGAWQFLDYAVYKMKSICPVASSVKELTAYVCKQKNL